MNTKDLLVDWYREVDDGDRVVRCETYDDIPSFRNRTKWQRRETVETPEGPVDVSTVFLSLDHGYREEAPVLYETMVFGGEFDQKQERYCTRKEAIEGHERWLAKVRKA